MTHSGHLSRLLIDEDLAGQVLEAWESREADYETTCVPWMLVSMKI